MSDSIDAYDYEEFHTKLPFNCMVISSIMTGKTYWVTHMLWPEIKYRFQPIGLTYDQKLKNLYYDRPMGMDEQLSSISEYTTVYVVSPEHNAPIYKKAIPHCQILSDFAYFDDFVDMLKLLQKGRLIGTDKDNENVYSEEILVIIDDNATKEIIESPKTIELYTKLRHFGISTIYCTQYPMVIVSQLMISNTTVFVLGKLNSRSARNSVRPIIEMACESVFPEIIDYSDSEEKAFVKKLYDNLVMRRKYGKLIIGMNAQMGMRIAYL